MIPSDKKRATGAVDGDALDWALRMAEPNADWDAFTLWLEADPANADRYDRASVALADATRDVAAATRAAPVAANDHDPVIAGDWRGRRGWIGGALAAALVGAVGIGAWQQRDQSYVVATAAGEQRSVTLGDGSTIMLAGGSRVRLDAARPRSATVEDGQMLFRVRHDAAAPFRVLVRDLALTDLGTTFDVSIAGARTTVAVAEGAVMVDPDGAALRLDPGEAVVADGATLRRETRNVADVGIWREGRLVFDGATLSDVAELLSRHLARRVSASAAVARRTFNGTLDLRALRDDPDALGALLDVRVRQDGGEWTLDAAR